VDEDATPTFLLHNALGRVSVALSFRRGKMPVVDVSPSVIWSRNEESAMMQDESQARTR
jgi:hypothetical protein